MDELPGILNLVNATFLSQHGFPPVMGEVFPHLFSEHNIENLRVIVEDREPISHVGIWEGDLLIYGSWFKVGMISCVCTHPEFRGRGYASSLVKDAFSKMKRDGVDLVLISGDRDLYRRFGCFRLGRIYRYKIPAGRVNFEKEKFDLIPYDERYLTNLVGLYQKEPLRYRRSLDDFKLLAERGLRCSKVPTKIFIAKFRGKPLAYIAAGLMPQEVLRGILRVHEYAGSRTAVLYLIEHLFRIMGSDVIEVIIPFHDLELLSILEEKGVAQPPLETPASMCIINPQSFIEKARPYLEERVVKENLSKLRIDVTDERITMTINRQKPACMDLKDLTFLFFGNPEQVQPSADLEPILKLLGESLPMPNPTYGLNFV